MRKLKFPGIILMVVLLAISGYAGYRTADLYFRMYEADDQSNPRDREWEEENPEQVDIINTLIIGLDSEDGGGRADTIMLARYNPNTKDVGLVSIPRDTLVKLPGRGEEKVGHATAYGGSSYLRSTVEEFLDLPVDHYVKVNLRGFRNIIDILDGVDIYVERDMYYRDQAAGFVIDLSEGQQVLDGDKAMQYVRFRSDSEGDIGRARRQQQLVKAVIDDLLQFSSVARINDLLEEAADNVKMDFTVSQLIRYSTSFHSIDWDGMESEVLPGENKKVNGVWYYLVDKEDAREIVRGLVDKKEPDTRSAAQ